MEIKVLMLLLATALILLTGCGQSDPVPDGAMPDIDIEVIGAEPDKEEDVSLDRLLSVHFINVGQGDAILLVQGGYSMLVDAGPVDAGATVFSYIRDLGIRTLDYIVATHTFADHVGGFPFVIHRTAVRNALIPLHYTDTAAYNAFLDELALTGATVVQPIAGEEFELGNAAVRILSPRPEDEFDNRANYSIVMMVEFGQTRFLLTGDAMREVEAILLDSDIRLSADVLKVARHGSASATTTGFLDAVSPSIAVISAEYGSEFLSRDTLQRLADMNVHVFRTDSHGNIIITSDGTRLSVTVEQN